MDQPRHNGKNPSGIIIKGELTEAELEERLKYFLEDGEGETFVQLIRS